MNPLLTPNESWSTLTTGAMQLVVQEALEMTWCLAGSYIESLTPRTRVRSSPLAGALMTTFLAPPSMWARAFSAAVNRPVDSSTISTPRSFQGIWPGSRWASTLMGWPSTVMESSLAWMSPGNAPYVLSYFRRWALV